MYPRIPNANMPQRITYRAVEVHRWNQTRCGARQVDTAVWICIERLQDQHGHRHVERSREHGDDDNILNTQYQKHGL